MSDLIYAPPEAAVEVQAAEEAEFYVVSPKKFFLLSFMTLNLYIVYWFYRNWKVIKLRTGESMWAPMRGLFYIFFAHSLFSRVNQKIEDDGNSFDWQPAALATIVVVLTILTNVLDRLAGNSVGSPVTDLVSIALVPILPVVLLKAQGAINVACNDERGRGNSSFTVANWIWMILGALIWVLVMFGLYVLFFAPELLVE